MFINSLMKKETKYICIYNFLKIIFFSYFYLFYLALLLLLCREASSLPSEALYVYRLRSKILFHAIFHFKEKFSTTFHLKQHFHAFADLKTYPQNISSCHQSYSYKIQQ
jgi:hypothetical protein